jgi:hypothetical protein
MNSGPTMPKWPVCSRQPCLSWLDPAAASHAADSPAGHGLNQQQRGWCSSSGAAAATVTVAAVLQSHPASSTSRGPQSRQCCPDSSQQRSYCGVWSPCGVMSARQAQDTSRLRGLRCLGDCPKCLVACMFVRALRSDDGWVQFVGGASTRAVCSPRGWARDPRLGSSSAAVEPGVVPWFP